MFKEGINFIFADPGDRFFRRSGLVLKRNPYLTLLLADDGMKYENVWFKKIAEPCFRCADRKKADEDCSANGLEGVITTEEKKTQKFIHEKLKKPNYAVVIDLSEFITLYSASDGLGTLEAALNKRNGSRLLLCSGLNAADSLKYFLDEKSPLRRLCPEIQHAVQSGKTDFFEALHDQLQDRMHILNAVAGKKADPTVKEELGAMISCLELKRNDFSLRSEDMDPPDRVGLVTLLFCAVHSPKLRRELGFQNTARTDFSGIYDSLSQNTCWEKTQNRLKECLCEATRTDMNDMREAYPDISENGLSGGLKYEDSITSKAAGMTVPDWYRTEQAEEALSELRGKLYTPYCKPRSAAVEAKIDEYIRLFNEKADRSSGTEEDCGYLEALMELLSFAADHLCIEEEKAEKLIERCEVYEGKILCAYEQLGTFRRELAPCSPYAEKEDIPEGKVPAFNDYWKAVEKLGNSKNVNLLTMDEIVGTPHKTTSGLKKFERGPAERTGHSYP